VATVKILGGYCGTCFEWLLSGYGVAIKGLLSGYCEDIGWLLWGSLLCGYGEDIGRLMRGSLLSGY